jgi:hypothetical protein
MDDRSSKRGVQAQSGLVDGIAQFGRYRLRLARPKCGGAMGALTLKLFRQPKDFGRVRIGSRLMDLRRAPMGTARF